MNASAEQQLEGNAIRPEVDHRVAPGRKLQLL